MSSSPNPVCGFSLDADRLPRFVQPTDCTRECADGEDRCLLHLETAEKSPTAVSEALSEGPRRVDGIQLRDFQAGGELAVADRELYAGNFNGAELEGVDFTGCKLNGSSFAGATLSSVQFDAQSDLSKVDFSDATLEGTQFSGSNLENSNLSGATGYSIRCHDAKLMDADLSGANFEDGVFTGANLRSATLTGTCLRRADLIGCNLEKATLAEADLRDCSLVFSKLRGADVRDVIADHRTNLGQAITDRERSRLKEVDGSLPGIGYQLDPDNLPSLSGRCWYEIEADVPADQLVSETQMLPTETTDAANEAANNLSDLRTGWLSRFRRRLGDVSDDELGQLSTSTHVYRDYQRISSENHLSGKHRTYRIRQGHAHRKHQLAAGKLKGWIRAAILRAMFRYGESPAQVILFSSVLIAGFAVLYPIFGVESTAGVHYRYAMDGSFSLDALVATVQLSLGQFFRTAAGGHSPVGQAAFLAELEVVSGTILISLFIFTLGRLATR